MALLNRPTDSQCAPTPVDLPGFKSAAEFSSLVELRRVLDPRAEELAVVVHELRNSLGIVRNAARLLRQPLAADRVETARSLIERHAGQMRLLLQDLLDTSHPGEHHCSLQLAHFDLRVIARYAIDAIASDLARRGHHLTVNLPTEALFVHADASRLEQVFANLLINAAKYTPAGGEISFSMELQDGQACLRIRDSGIGMTQANIAHIFDLFMQVDPEAPRAEGGHGIGLAVVRDIVELHGGSVRATSAGLGLGSEFVVLLPSIWNAPAGPR